MFTRPLTRSRRRQRGVGTLIVALILLFAASLGALYVNRGVLVEQRTSANQMQATLSHEVAEAALEWATGMLNAPYDVGPNCTYDNTAGNTSFRKRYVMTQTGATPPSTDIVPATTIFPGCKIDPATGALTCNCPKPGDPSLVASLGSAVQPGFTVAFEAVPGNNDAVKITAWACSAQAATCASTSYGNADGNARLSVTLKLGPSPLVSTNPLTCGTSCEIGGSMNVVNTDVGTNGITINAGTTITTAPGTTVTTLVGQPVANSQIANDASLSALSSADPTCENSKMFKTYFGMTIERYRDAPTTKVISCGSANDCKTQIDAAYAQGWRSFYFASDLHLSGNNTYGSQADPIIFVTPNAIDFNGDNVLYGMIFSNSSDWHDLGTGSAKINGSQITCAAYKSTGNGTINYDPLALNNARRMSAPLVRIPGSWRDFRTNTDTLP
jgi:hypothetical protein